MNTIVVIISANAEWRNVKAHCQPHNVAQGPYGEWFHWPVAGRMVVFVHGGWGKIAAAASAQYAIERWKPVLLINLGTCGGFAGAIQPGEVVLAERTVVYDIIEQMGDPEEALSHYATALDLSWLGDPPQAVRRGVLVSADRDLLAEQVSELHARYGGAAGDWESGAIAWVAARHQLRCLILRGVTDLVGEEGGEAYGALTLFHDRTHQVMVDLLDMLPAWLDCAGCL